MTDLRLDAAPSDSPHRLDAAPTGTPHRQAEHPTAAPAPAAPTPVAAPAAPPPLAACWLPIAALALDPDHPRLTLAAPDLEALAASVRAHGVLQPLLVMPHPAVAARAATPFLIIAGGRRWAAARLAGLAAVPAVVRGEPLSPADRLMLQLDENDGELRRGLSLYERARAVARALALSGLGKLEFARRHRRSPAWCSHYIRLAEATGAFGDALREGHLTTFLIANLFSRLPDLDQQRLLAAARRDGSPITAQQVEIAAQRSSASRAAAAAAAAVIPGATAALLAEDCRMTVHLTPPQLDALLLRLGRHPHGSPTERVEQLYTCLA